MQNVPPVMQLFDSDVLTLDPDVYHTYFGLLDIYLLSYNSVSKLEILKCNMMLYCIRLASLIQRDSVYSELWETHAPICLGHSLFLLKQKKPTSYRHQTFRNFVWMHFCQKKKKKVLAFSWRVFHTESDMYFQLVRKTS